MLDVIWQKLFSVMCETAVSNPWTINKLCGTNDNSKRLGPKKYMLNLLKEGTDRKISDYHIPIQYIKTTAELNEIQGEFD